MSYQACGPEGLSPLSEAVAFILNQGSSSCSLHSKASFVNISVGEGRSFIYVFITQVFMETIGPATRNSKHGYDGTVPHPLSV